MAKLKGGITKKIRKIDFKEHLAMIKELLLFLNFKYLDLKKDFNDITAIDLLY